MEAAVKGEDCTTSEEPLQRTRGGAEEEGKTSKTAKKEEGQAEEDKCALAKAVLGGKQKLANDLLKSGADFSRRDNDGRTPLHHAALGGYHRICSLLVRKGADKDAQDKQGDSPNCPL